MLARYNCYDVPESTNGSSRHGQQHGDRPARASRTDLIDDMWDHGSSDGAIVNNIKNGVAPDFNMAPWKDMLKDDEIWNVVTAIHREEE